jgi:hypothetical protein
MGSGGEKERAGRRKSEGKRKKIKKEKYKKRKITGGDRKNGNAWPRASDASDG